MGLEGHLETVSLSGILQLLCREEKTGILRVRNGDTEYQLFFLKGSLLYAIESYKEARLGALLIEDGLATAEIIRDCLIEARSKKLAIGKILVENGYIPFKILEKYIYKQILEILLHTFKWNKGRFVYQDMRYNLRWLVVVKLSTLQLVMEAMRILDEEM